MNLRRSMRWPAVLMAAGALAIGTGVLPAASHDGEDMIKLYPPISDGDDDHSDTTSWWNRFGGTDPASHHIVYGHWGYPNDWSVDIYAPLGSTIVSPFGTQTTTGHPTEITVVDVRLGCRSGVESDGGHVVTLQAVDTSTGAVLARADVMHVDDVSVAVGDVLGPWDRIGVTSRFSGTPTTCYDVSTDEGVHAHLEVINQHRFACYVPRGQNEGMTESTHIGYVGNHADGQRAQC